MYIKTIKLDSLAKRVGNQMMFICMFQLLLTFHFGGDGGGGQGGDGVGGCGGVVGGDDGGDGGDGGCGRAGGVGGGGGCGISYYIEKNILVLQY